MDKTVSAVMPAYNAERTIGLAIESVLAQTHSNLELVIVDDASSDRTAEVVRAYADDRIKLLSLPKNSGEGAARDAAIAASTGDWVAVIDADDAWEDTRLEKLLCLATEDDERCILIDDIAQCFAVGDELVPFRPVRGSRSSFLDTREKALVDLLRESGYLIKPLIPRSAIESLGLRHSDLRYGADAQFFIRLIKHGGMKIRCLNEPLYLYRMTPGAMSTISGSRVIMRDMLLGLSSELDLSRPERRAIARKVRAQERHIEFEPFAEALKARDYGAALKYGALHPRCVLLFLWRLPKALLFKRAVTSRGGSARPLH